MQTFEDSDKLTERNFPAINFQRRTFIDLQPLTFIFLISLSTQKMNQMLGNDPNLLNDDDSSGSSEDFSDSESDDNDDSDVKNLSNSRRELDWDDSTMNF